MNSEYSVILFYKFIEIANPQKLKEEQEKLCRELGLTGRLLIATEGINGTFEGTTENIKKYTTTMHCDDRFADIKFKTSAGTGSAFPKLKIKVRDEIVTLRASRNICPAIETASELTAEELELWYEKGEDFVILDLRNDYEIKSGYFEKTLDPGLRNFRDLNDDKIRQLAEDPRVKGKKVLTVCTGGIRCEKATCLMDSELFPELYQLKDGIHDYMEKFPNSHFKGTLFVFDNRTATDLGAGDDREVVAACRYCDQATENYVNDDSKDQSEKIVCCEDCFARYSDSLRTYVSQ